MKTGLRLCVAALGLAVVVGCSSEDPGADGSAETTTHTGDAPRDRDGDAVMAAVRQLDLCSVLAAADPSAKPVAGDPFSCGSAGKSIGFVQKNADARLKMPVREIGGVKAYTEFSVYDDCRVYLPVSFELALELREGPPG
jgi:hypothetical protein